MVPPVRRIPGAAGRSAADLARRGAGIPRLGPRWLLAVGFLAVLALALGGALPGAARQVVSLPATPAATPAPGSPPASCQIGLDLTSLRNVDLTKETFDAGFWLWSVCPDARFKPLETMEFANANSVQMTKQTRSVVDGLVWDYAQVSGTFRHHWDVTDFPFDRQSLRIEILETAHLASELVYEPDHADSTVETDASLPGWRIERFDLAGDVRTYHTSYGNPVKPVGSDDYSRIVMTVDLERNELASFFKLTFVVYVAFVVLLVSYFINLNNPSMLTARLGIISGMLFAVAVNLRTATSALSSEDGLTMVDKIHLAALAAILIDAVAALATQLLLEREIAPARVTRFNRIVMAAVVLAFVAANLWLVGRAALG